MKTKQMIEKDHSPSGDVETGRLPVDFRPIANPIPEVDERQYLVEIMKRANAIASSTDIDELLSQMLELMLKVMQAETVTFFWFDPEADEWVVQSVHGDVDSQYLIGLRMKRQESPFGKTDLGQIPVIIGDVAHDPCYLWVVNPAHACRTGKVILLPLQTKDRVLGMIQMVGCKNLDMEILSLLSERLANEIDRLQEVVFERRAIQRLQALLDVSSCLANAVDRSSVLRTVTETVCDLVDAERSSVFMIDPDTNEMAFRAYYQDADPPESAGKPGIGGRTVRAFPQPKRENKPVPTRKTSSDLNFYSPNAITVSIPALSAASSEKDAPRVNLGGIMAFANSSASFHEEDFHLLEILAQQTSAFLRVADLHDTTAELFLDSVTALVAAIDAKDPYTQGHSQRVSDYSMLIGQELALSEGDLYNLRLGSLFHDVGKIGIPDAILKSTAKLGPEEWEIVKRHPLTGLNILNKVKMLAQSLPAVLEHHERLDGSGYPNGLNDQQISLQGKIVAVTDVFDAMTSNRTYRGAMDVSTVLEHLHANQGRLFDARCVEALVDIVSRTKPDQRKM